MAKFRLQPSATAVSQSGNAVDSLRERANVPEGPFDVRRDRPHPTHRFVRVRIVRAVRSTSLRTIWRKMDLTSLQNMVFSFMIHTC